MRTLRERRPLPAPDGAGTRPHVIARRGAWRGLSINTTCTISRTACTYHEFAGTRSHTARSATTSVAASSLRSSGSRRTFSPIASTTRALSPVLERRRPLACWGARAEVDDVGRRRHGCLEPRSCSKATTRRTRQPEDQTRRVAPIAKRGAVACAALPRNAKRNGEVNVREAASAPPGRLRRRSSLATRRMHPHS